MLIVVIGNAESPYRESSSAFRGSASASPKKRIIIDARPGLVPVLLQTLKSACAEMADGNEKSVPPEQGVNASNGHPPQTPGTAGKLGPYKTAIDVVSKADETVLRLKK